jgi:hypothetical protein
MAYIELCDKSYGYIKRKTEELINDGYRPLGGIEKVECPDPICTHYMHWHWEYTITLWKKDKKKKEKK